MDVKEIKRLLDAVVAADVAEFYLEQGEFKMSVKRHGDAPANLPGYVAAAPLAAPLPVSGPSAFVASAVPAGAGPTVPVADPSSGSGESVATTGASRGTEVTAPIVGTFYASPSPDAPAYVKVGDKVKVGTVLCIIEAMKLMNEIEAETAGTVTAVLVRNEEPVEFGQALFRIEPD